MTQTIEQLQARVAMLSQERNGYREASDRACEERDEFKARVAELEAENARLKTTPAHKRQDLHCVVSDMCDQIREGEKQLLLAQAEIKRLRDAVESVCCDPDGNVVCFQNQADNWVLQDALAQPSDTSALDAYVAEKVKEAMR